MKKRTFSVLLGTFFVLASLSCRAQFIGYTSPQTVQTKLASGTSCTGSPQTFITGTAPGFSNIGQTLHTVTSQSNAQQFTMELDGIDVTGNVFRISDVQVGTAPGGGTGGLVPAVLSGTGYYAQLQVQVTCSPVSATFTATYTGYSSATNPASGTAFLSSTDKNAFQGMPANTNQTVQFQTPFGNSQGLILFQYQNTASVAGSTLTMSCLSAKSNIVNQVSVSLANNTQQQVFQMPDGVCPFALVSYGSGGATTATIQVEYVFAAPGVQQAADPCLNGVKKSVSIAISTATTTQLVAGSGNLAIYVCGFSVTETGTVPTFQFEDGTGATCAASTTVLTGVYAPLTGTPFVQPVGGTFIFAPLPSVGGTAALGLCVVTGGTTPSLQGALTYVQQ